MGSYFSTYFTTESQPTESQPTESQPTIRPRPSLSQKITGHAWEVTSVSFSPDGARIVSGSDDSTVRVWDASTGALLHTLQGHTRDVMSVSFSPDGKRIVSGSYDKTMRVWDANPTSDKQCLVTLKGHRSSVNSVSFSPYGARLVSGSNDKTVRVWNIMLLEWVELQRDINALRGETEGLAQQALSIYAQYTLQARLNTLVKRATDDGLDIDTLVASANAEGLRLLGVQGLSNLIGIMAGITRGGGGKSKRSRGGGESKRSKRQKRPTSTAVMLRF